MQSQRMPTCRRKLARNECISGLDRQAMAEIRESGKPFDCPTFCGKIQRMLAEQAHATFHTFVKTCNETSSFWGNPKKIGKFREGESLLRQALLGQPDIRGVQLDADGIAPEPPGYRQRRSCTAERVQHGAAGRTYTVQPAPRGTSQSGLRDTARLST